MSTELYNWEQVRAYAVIALNNLLNKNTITDDKTLQKRIEKCS